MSKRDMNANVSQPLLSVVIPTMGRPTVVRTIDSLTKVEGFEDIEILICGNIHNRQSLDAIGAYCDRYPNVTHLACEYETGDSSRKKNKGAQCATAEIVAFLDDDVVVEGNWAAQTLRSFANDEIGLVSGPSLVPEDINIVGRLAGMALSSPAAGYAANRYLGEGDSVTVARWSDIIGCNMAYRKHVLEDIGMFDPDYWPGEEMIASFKTQKGGWKLMFNSGARVYHYPRQSLLRFWKQIWGYGATRIRLIRGGAEVELSTLVPAVWVLSLVALGVSAIFHPLPALLLLLDLLLYALVAACVTVGMVLRSRNPKDILLLFMIPYMHLSYGLAEWVELFFPNRDLSEKL